MDPRTLRIRTAHLDEVDDLVRMRQALTEHVEARGGGGPVMTRGASDARREAYRRRLADPTYRVLVAEAPGGELVGTATGSALVDTQVLPAHQGRIGAVWVEPTARRSGVCRGLIREILEFFRGAGVEHVFLDYQCGNSLAERTWVSLGFEPTEVAAYVDCVALREYAKSIVADVCGFQPRVRAAVPADAWSVARMTVSARRDMALRAPLTPGITAEGEAALAERCRAWIGDPSVHVVVAELAGGELVGLVVGRATDVPEEIPERQGRLWPVWVENDHRRLGLARRMVGEVAAHWTEAGVSLASGMWFPGDAASEGASRSLGFRPVDVFARASFDHVWKLTKS